MNNTSIEISQDHKNKKMLTTNVFSNKPEAQAAGADPSNATPPVGKIHPLRLVEE